MGVGELGGGRGGDVGRVTAGRGRCDGGWGGGVGGGGGGSAHDESPPLNDLFLLAKRLAPVSSFPLSQPLYETDLNRDANPLRYLF